jgi:dihydropyrimidinase
MRFDRIVKGGSVVTPAGSFVGDVGIVGEKIAALATELEPAQGTEVIDATGHHVLPGVLDVHVHLELPFCGTVSADDYRTGTRAGARGGVTTVIDFAIPYAGESLDQAADNWLRKAEGKALVDYTFHICITRWSEHQSQIKGMVDRGFTTFKEFMIYESEGWQSDDRALFGTLEQMREHGTMLLVHAESARVLDELIARHHTPELMGRYGARLHPMTRPNFVEAEAIQRVVQWCEATGGQLYIVHMSTAEGADIVRAAQSRGVPVLAETCAQYLGRTGTSLHAVPKSRSRKTSIGSGRDSGAGRCRSCPPTPAPSPASRRRCGRATGPRSRWAYPGWRPCSRWFTPMVCWAAGSRWKSCP